MSRVRYFLLFAGFLIIHLACLGQQTDTLPQSDSTQRGSHKKSPYSVDSLTRKQHDPRKATIRSAIIPGWGQIYNHKYWKLPIVYAAIGIPAYTFFYNRTSYNNYQQAISIVDTYAQLGAAAVPDSVLNKLPSKIQYLVTVGYSQENTLRNYRNEFRKDEDYSALFFLLFWGLNVVDATVDAHLMYFDVSDKLSMHLQQPSPGFIAPGAGAAGLSLVFDFHKPRYKLLSMR
ncbi:MAG TPA: DUF5683 domain-containing protein [Puia sp.]|jgi:hypothetical protein|nr:DUF5683 domain-containing protein [Puia sp.]